jgi:hypothetical protein
MPENNKDIQKEPKNPPFSSLAGNEKDEELEKDLARRQSNNPTSQRLEELKGFENEFRQNFAPYRDMINDFTNRFEVETMSDVIQCQVSNDCSRILVLLKADDETSIIQQYNVADFSLCFERKLTGEHVKANLIK